MQTKTLMALSSMLLLTACSASSPTTAVPPVPVMVPLLVRLLLSVCRVTPVLPEMSPALVILATPLPTSRPLDVASVPMMEPVLVAVILPCPWEKLTPVPPVIVPVFTNVPVLAAVEPRRTSTPMPPAPADTVPF